MRLFLHTKKIALVRFLFTPGSHRIGFSASGVRIRSASECIGSVSVCLEFESDRLRFDQGSNRSTSDYTGSVSVCSGFGPDLFDFPSGAFCFCVPPVRGRLEKMPTDSAVRFPGRLESGSGRGSMIFHRALFVFVFARSGAGLKKTQTK